MRNIKTIGAIVLAAAALGSLAAATASAALPGFLPGAAGEKLSDKGGSATLEIPAKV